MPTRDPYDLTTIEAAAESAQEDARLTRQQQVDDLKWLMAHASGRRFVGRLLQETGVLRTSFHHSGSTMAFNEGRKTIGYFLTGELLDITPDAYLRLLKEFRNE
jgi:hypothetical protein